MRAVFALAAAASILAPGIYAQSAPSGTGVRPHIIVTVEGKHDAEPPQVQKGEVVATLDRKPATIADWVPLAGDQAALQFYIVIDDGTSRDLANQYSDIRAFIQQLPPSAEVGLAYLRNGSAQVAQTPTTDRAKVSGSLRIPLGEPGISASPYMGISDLIKKWPATEARREILMISSGIDPYYEPGPQNPYLDSAISEAQRQSVVVHSIYYAGTGHFGHSFWRVNWGQNYLSQLGDETGGEAYWQGTMSPVSFSPFLKDLSMRLRNQYLLVFDAHSAKTGWQNIKLGLEKNTGEASLVTASRVWVK